MAENKILPTAPEEIQSSPGHRIALSNTLLVALSLVLVCAVAWAFFMGFMVGRGQNPAEDIASLTGLVPNEPEAKTTPAQDTMPMDEQPAAASVHQPPTGEAAKAWQANAAPPARPLPKSVPPRPKPKPAKPVQTAPAQQYNYTFQVAALRNSEDAAALQKTLRQKGLNAATRKSGKVTLLIVNLRGTRDDVEKLSTTLKTAKLGKPLQLSRTPVLPPAKKQR